jgi:hypothetical protein
MLVCLNSVECDMFKLREQFGRVGVSDVRMQEMPGLNQMMAKVVLSRDKSVSDSHMHFFLLLPNDTSVPCLGGNHSVP